MKLHHVGIIVRSIAEYGPVLSRALASQARSPVEHDPVQEVRVQFFATEDDHVSIELIEPDGESSPVYKSLQNGGGFAHLCYEVADIAEAIRNALEQGAILVSGPSAAVAFQGRRIAFVFYRSIGLVEFLESRQ